MGIPTENSIQKARRDDFLSQLLERVIHEDIPDLRELVPYLGGHWDIAQAATRHKVGYMPSGAGGFHANWTFFGSPEQLKRFFDETDLSEELNPQHFSSVIAESMDGSACKAITLKGRIPTLLNPGPGFGANQDFIDLFGDPCDEVFPQGTLLQKRAIQRL